MSGSVLRVSVTDMQRTWSVSALSDNSTLYEIHYESSKTNRGTEKTTSSGNRHVSFFLASKGGTQNMRNITAKELWELGRYHAKEGDELLSIAYYEEEKALQGEMNQDI